MVEESEWKEEEEEKRPAERERERGKRITGNDRVQ